MLYPLGLGGTGQGSNDEQIIPFLNEILDQLKADYFKSDTRFIRYRENTQQIILDKDVSFDFNQGYTITAHQLIQAPSLNAIQNLPDSQVKTLLLDIIQHLKADYFKGDSRFIKYAENTQQTILDKDVTFDVDTGYTVTQH
jgi:hypothetical protein